MNILFIIKVKILEVVKWSFRSPSQVMLIIELRMVNNFCTCSPMSSELIHVFVVFDLKSTPNHTHATQIESSKQK